MKKVAFDSRLLRLALGIPAAGIGGLLGYATAPKNHGWEGMARGAGMGYMAGTGATLGGFLGNVAAPETHDQVPYSIGGAVAGGALGLGVGKMMQGQPEWEKRKQFREELLAALRDEAASVKRTPNKKSQIASVLQGISDAKTAGSTPLRTLLEAKQLSDRGEYKGKHQKLRSLMEKYPDDFFVDSVNGNIAGITHRPTGFKIHAPLRVLPITMRGFTNVEASVA